MSDDKLLTKDIAEQFLADFSSVDVSKFTAIVDEAAAVLAKYDDDKNTGLNLSGLKNLTEAAATHLGTGTGNFKAKAGLNLSGLSESSEQAVAYLLQHNTNMQLNTLSDATAMTIAQKTDLPLIQLEQFPALPGHISLAKRIASDGWRHSLNEVERIIVLHPEIAEAFAHSPSHLPFAAVKDISLETAKALSGHKKGRLRLNGLESVPEDVAATLSKHGPALFMPNLRTIDETKGHKQLLRKLIKSQDRAVFAFNKLPLWLAEDILERLHKSTYTSSITFRNLNIIDGDVLHLICEYTPYGNAIYLDDLKEFPTGAAEAIATHKNGTLSFRSVTSISDAIALALGRHTGEFDVSGVVQVSYAAAEHLARSEHSLYLDSLTTIDASVAEALSKHRGERLSLTGVKSMSLSALQALCRYVGKLSLGIAELDEEQAKALSRHTNELEINFVTHCGTVAAKHLSSHRFCLRMLSLSTLTLEAAKELSEHPGPIWVNLEKLPQNAAELLKDAFPNKCNSVLRK